MSASAAERIEQGRTARNLGNLEVAQSRYEEAAAIYRTDANANALKLAHTIRHVGDIRCDRGDLSGAEPCYVEALAIYRREPDTKPLDLANTLNHFAYLKAQRGQDETAIEFWIEAKDLYASVHVTAGVDGCATELARAAGRRDLA